MKRSVDLLHNTALITGASSGIGKELATIHAEQGGDLVLVARSADRLHQLKHDLEAKYNITAHVIVCDLGVAGAGRTLYDMIQTTDITVDILINNAGFGGQGYFHERDRALDSTMIQLNVMTLTELTRLFLPDFVARGSGCVLNVSSTASFVPGPLQAVYYATKSYVQSFTNAIARELSGTGVTVTNLMPGPTATQFEARAELEKTALFATTASARRVAQDGYKAMHAGKLDVISGLTFGQRVMIALLPFIPKHVKLDVVFRMQRERSGNERV